MSEPPTFDRILASLNDAMLDDTCWPTTSALIDEVCRTQGNCLTFAKGRPDYVRSSCSNLRTGPRPDPGGVHGVLQLFRPVLGHRHALPAT